MAIAERRLVGDDARLYRMALGTEVIGNGTLAIAPATWVKITAKASSSSDFEPLAVGDLFYNNTASPITPPAGDKWRPITLSDMADLAGWSLEVTSDKIDVTVTADGVRKYRSSKKDAQGSASVVFVKGYTDDPSVGMLNSFYKVVRFDADGTITADPVTTEPFFLLGYLDYTDEIVGHHKLATAMEIEFENFPLNFKMGEASNVDMNFHLVGDTDPIIYRIENA